MKILLIGTPRLPTLNVGSNGLGRHTYDLLSQLAKKDNLSITTILHKDSKLEWDKIKMFPFYDERSQLQDVRRHIIENAYDVVLDFTHLHLLGQTASNEELPVINYILDEECPYQPPNSIVGNEWQKRRYNTSKIIRTGIDLTKYPFISKKQDYMSFCGKIEHRKGYDIAFNMGKMSGQLVRFAGPDNDGRARELGTWIGEITDHEEFCKFVGNSKCLLYPSRNDAGGMAIWEAMALGTPTITTDNSGAQCHVHDGITGFVVSNMEQALEAISNISNLNPSQIREMCAQEWDLNKTFENFYQQIQRFVDGERW